MRGSQSFDVGPYLSDYPLFQAIARAIADDIVSGRLQPGSALPGSRSLAESLGVHRNTVLAAYRELYAEGYTTTTAAQSTRVREDLPPTSKLLKRTPARNANDLGFDLPPNNLQTQVNTEPPRGTIALFGGLPDLSSLPLVELSRAYRRALLQKGSSALGYGDPQGEPSLRAALAELVRSRRGINANEDDVVVTRGSQLALYLVARALLAPGDLVVVEAWGYRPAWQALTEAGAELVGVAVDTDGLDIDALEQLLVRKKIKAVYVTPHHQYPTTALLSQERRLRLLALARKHRFAIIEDDYDHEFHYDSKPVLPLMSRDRSGVVIYLGTLSKILAPGLRIGFVIAPRAVQQRITALRVVVDRQGSRAEERAVAELCEDGTIERHARRMRRLYMGRRDTLTGLLERHFGDRLSYDVPTGGMALWAHAPGVDVDAWAARGEAKGVLVQTAKRFTFDGSSKPFLRLGFASQPEAKLRTAIERLRAALDAS